MNYGSVCSGIEAASVAWEPLGWEPAWFSEIEKFPAAVLAHHWPEVMNHGDMTALPAKVANDNIPAPDVLVGGTPCQAFSVAGKRGSLSDERGALTLAYVELANEIDRKRAAAGLAECVIVWENVPGVLNTKDNAFGCFLGALAGEDGELQPSGKRWTNAGCVFGPQRAVAWRILDAQYFGVAQRRRRVFVVASARDGFDPAAVLFEREGVRRDTAPSREAKKEPARNAGCGAADAGRERAVAALTSSGVGTCGADDNQAQAGHLIPAGWPAEVASTLNAAFGSKLGLEDQHVNSGCPLFVPAQPANDNRQAVPILEPGARTGKSTTDPRAGIGIGDNGDPMFTLQAGKQHCVAYNVHENQRAELTLNDTADSIKCGGGKPGQGYPAVLSVTGEITHALNTANNGKGCSEDGTGRGVPTVAVHGTQDPDVCRDHSHPIGRNNGQENAIYQPQMAVRRLTPIECERLQGFPDGHTAIPWRGKPADKCPDGPRYKAIGNSMAVPCMRFIGERIAARLNPPANDNEPQGVR